MDQPGSLAARVGVKRRILIVAPEAYPPAPAVGCVRVGKFIKYLPEFGFESSVLTVPVYGRLDSDRELRVYRAFDPEPIYRALARALRLGAPPGRAVAGGGAHSRPSRIKRLVLEDLAIPDLRIAWLPAAVVTGLRVVRRHKPALILSDSPSETSHLVGGCLAAMTGLPWVADFRDGWVFESLKPALRRPGMRRRIEQRLERWVVGRADAIVTVSEPITRYFQEAYPASARKCVTITNGYDPADWEGVTLAPREPGKMRLVYTGSFGNSRSTSDPEPFLAALAGLSAQLRSQLEVLLVGPLTGAERAQLAAFNLDDLVEAVGPVSRAESLGYQLSADVLLLLAGNDVSVATSKLYEYLFAGRPILAVSHPDSAAASIVSQAGAGRAVSPSDPVPIARALEEMFVAWREGRLAVRPAGIERYNRRRLTGELAGVLEAAIGAKVPGLA